MICSEATPPTDAVSAREGLEMGVWVSVTTWGWHTGDGTLDIGKACSSLLDTYKGN